MVKKIHYQECRTSGRKRRSQPPTRFVFEPVDAAVAAAAVALVLWLQWFAALPS